VCTRGSDRAPACGPSTSPLGVNLGRRRELWRGWYAYRMKVGEVLRMLHADGWYLVATRGSHRQFKHPNKPGRVTVAGKPSDDLAPGTLNSILKQSGLKR
jgi:predicted RNA binding protein YcfA (HicA-like mRNA interferase family)